MKRKIADLVQEQCALVRQLKSAHGLCNCTRECPFFMPEEFALQQICGDRGAIHFYERCILSRTLIVNCPSNQFFSRPGFPLDQDDRIRGRNNFHSLQHRLKAGARYNQPARAEIRAILSRPHWCIIPVRPNRRNRIGHGHYSVSQPLTAVSLSRDPLADLSVGATYSTCSST